jgi:hypothetical protein
LVVRRRNALENNAPSDKVKAEPNVGAMAGTYTVRVKQSKGVFNEHYFGYQWELLFLT